MIKIEIGIKDDAVYDSIKKVNTNLQEVGAVLLRLKQIEHKLININFDNIIEVDEDVKDE